MVNYCCVVGCGRNSRNNKHLNYYGLPKERHRQEQWLRAAGRKDLLEKEPTKLTVSYRFCSRHFSPMSTRNRNLGPDVVPTFYVPGFQKPGPGEGESYAELDHEPKPHDNIVCNVCNEQIIGFRYKCVYCSDFDLCQKCESLELHPQHFMLRIPKPMKFKFADKILKKLQEFFKAEYFTPDTEFAAESSDDEPITKYAKNYDSGIDLSEDVKSKIRKEVSRVLKVKDEMESREKSKGLEKPKIQKKNRKRSMQDEKPFGTKRVRDEPKNESENIPEVVFADVNDLELKTEVSVASEQASVQESTQEDQPSSNESVSDPYLLYTSGAWCSKDNAGGLKAQTASSSDNTERSHGVLHYTDGEEVNTDQPVMHVKLSEDMTELMIEVTSKNQKTIYKC